MVSEFENLGVSSSVAKAMDTLGWTVATPIQRESIPEGISGNDMFAQAQTGTGKTGAFGAIILSKVPTDQKIPTSIILAPTRELATQVADEMNKLAMYSGHKCVAIYGGASIEGQITKLNKGADVIAGTPGRVKDMIQRGNLNLSKIQILVLDEADRMLDMGFIEDIEYILSAMPRSGRQTMLFSATLSENVKRLATDYMVKPKEVTVSEDELVLDLTKQYYISVGRKNKVWALCRILDLDKPKAIIFCQTKKMVDILDERLKGLEYKAEAIHGDMSQSRRETVLKAFRDDRIDILIATDVAARGLDIDDIAYVINYDVPDNVDTYIHRIGRTGRAGKEGIAVSFVTTEEEYIIREIVVYTGMEITKRDVPEVEGKDTVRKVVDYDQISDRFGMVKFEVNLGKKDGLGKVGLADFIIWGARIRDTSIGKIEVGPESSVLEVHKEFANRMAMDLPREKYRGKKISVRVVH
ncbi:MAG: DEAD/DEAH box helicase [Methanomassiliicoccaceae archaeon]|jgi:ATP-dependent RNA helicase DeaD|nr:DEAD/DEAH box helicase [Methanomassiliicoccaceae archaeon]